MTYMISLKCLVCEDGIGTDDYRYVEPWALKHNHLIEEDEDESEDR